jgi:TP901 family phage tail tape measure protein
MAQAFNLTARINMQGPYNLRPIVSKIKKDIGAIKPELKFKLDPAAASNVKKITAEIKKLDSATKSAQKSVGSLNTQLLSLASSFNNAATASKNASNAAANVSKATSNAAKSANQARTAIEEFGKQSGLAIKRFAAFSSVTGVIFGITNAITNAYKEFLVFNKEIVRLSQVTDKSVSDLKGISNEITRLSTTIGVASSDLITVASTLAQAGLSAEDTRVALEALAKSSLAPSFENISDTTEGAIAAIRQFGLQASELESALGSINAVAASFAVEAGDIISAIQRTGGVFASASRGVSEGTDALNEFVAIFTSIRQTTRESAETIATGLRTIFTRIQRSSTIELLKQYGVELRDLEGKFVGPYEAVRRLSDGLSRIDPRSADFARISEELGGFRQIGKVIPLIQQFAVAQDALNVAQKGSGSLSRDVQTAQQSLAVQFAKTRENFLALVREIGDSQSFKAIVNSTLFLTNALIDLGRALKPLLPLLLTFGAIKVGGGINQFLGGFGLAFNRGGGGAGGGPIGGGGGGSGGGPGGNQPLTSALSLNTAATNAINQTLATLNTSVLSLNQNIVNTNSLLLNRPARGFASGGLVPGRGNSDTFRANLTPGEFVIRKKAVESIGAENLAQMNRGGAVQRFAQGGISKKLQKKIIDSNSYENFLTQNMLDPFGMNPKSKIYNFGMVGLRSGTKSSANRTELRKLSNGSTARIHVGFLQGKAGFEQQIGSDIENNLKKTIVKTAGAFSSQIGGSTTNKTLQQQILGGAVLSSAVGSVFESALQMVGAPYIDKIESIKSMDFPFGLGSASKLFGSFPDNIPTDATRTIAGSGKGISDFVGQINRFVQAIAGNKFTEALEPLPTPQAMSASSLAQRLIKRIKNNIGDQSTINDILVPFGFNINKRTKADKLTENLKKAPSAISVLEREGFAKGGSVEDTIPALLTPGEFVFNKKSAQRIGYGNLNRLNKADKVQGFNKGGIVGYAAGGAVATDPAVIGAALASVLLPQVQRLADTFSKLEGTAGQFGTALGGAIREASSTILSSTIALQAVGASQGTVRAAQIGGGLTSAIAGGITDSSAKALEKALLANTSAINKFETNLQDIANAPTEELRLEASKRLEKAFTELDISVRNSKDNIDKLENLKNFGDTMQSVNMIALTTVTAMTALNAASSKAALAVSLSQKTVGVMAPLSVGTKLLGTFGKAIPVIGGLIGIISTGIELWGFFNTKLKSSNEQFERLNKALDETVKNSNAYNLGNKNFVENILPQFQGIVDRARSSANPQETIQNELSRLPSTSALDLRFRQRLIPRAQEIGIGISPNETVADIENKLMGTGLETAFQKIVKELQDVATKSDAVSYLIEKGGMEREQAEKKVNELVKNDQNELRRLASTYNASKNKEILMSRLVADAANRVQVSLVNLDNIFTRTSALYEKSLTTLTNSFEDLDSRTNLLLGQPNIDMSRGPSRDIQTLQNLMGSSNQEVVDVMRKFTQNANLPGDLGGQLTKQVEAAQTLEKQMGIVLNKLAESGVAGNLDVLLKDTLGKALEASIGTGPEARKTIDTILTEVGANLNNSLAQSNAPKTLKELASTNKVLDATFQSGQRSIKFVIDALDIYAKGLKSLSEQQKQTIELENQIRQKTLQRIESDKKASIQFREIFDIEVPLADRLDVFNAGIRQQTAGIGQLPAGGTTNLLDINAERQRIGARIQDLQQQDQTNKLTGKQSEELRKNISELQTLTNVIEKIADGGEQVNLVFEAIAKQRDQFKTQREVLIDILKKSRDPAQQLQLRAEFEAVMAVAGGGRFSEAQAFRALDSSLMRMFSTEQQNTMVDRIISGLGIQAKQFATPDEKTSVNRVLSQFALQGLSPDLLASLFGARSQQRAATNIQTNELEKARDNRIQESIKTIDDWIKALKTSAQLVGELTQLTQSTVQGRPTPKVTSAQDIKTMSSIVNDIANLSVLQAADDFNIVRENLFDTTEINNLNERLTRLQNEGRGFGGKDGIGVELQRFLVQKQLSPEFQVLNPQLTELVTRISRLIQESNKAQQTQPAPAFNPRTQPIPAAALDPRATERFSTSATQLASALTGDNTNITQLSTAVNSLTPATNDLKNAVNQLSALFKDGKIQISQETKGQVDVNFNNSLPIERDANSDNRFLEQVGRIAQDTISEQLRSFIRQYS